MPIATVFISYNHENTPQAQGLVSVLTEKGYKCIWDGGSKDNTDFRVKLSQKLNECDVIVPIITSDWLRSHECRDELVRAHERRKTIIPFAIRSLREEKQNKLPFFLQNLISVQWEAKTITGAQTELLQRLQEIFEQGWKQDCYREIRLLGDEVQKAEVTAPWQESLSKHLIKTAREQIRDVVRNRCEAWCSFNVSYENAYLKFAGPVFRNAETIIAVCIARISTFWVNQYYRPIAGDYLKDQHDSASSICRLFVFDTAAETNHYKNVLQTHHELYGKDLESSGVFLCSAETYKAFLSSWANDANNPRHLQEDFGILSFKDSPIRMRAELNPQQFRFREYDPTDATEAENHVIEQQFARLRSLRPGEIDAETGIARWSPEWHSDSEQFAVALEKMFNSGLNGVHHVVMLKPQPADSGFERHMQDLAGYFTEHQQLLGISRITLGKRCTASGVVDGRFRAALTVKDDFEFVLTLEFKDEAALLNYYQHELHSQEREKLYSKLDPAVKLQFEQLRTNGELTPTTRARHFLEIEEQVTSSGGIRRYDMAASVPFRNTVRLKGEPFGQHKK